MVRNYSFSPKSMILFQGFVGLSVGFLLGIVYAFGGFFIDLMVSMGWYATTDTPGLSIGTVYAFGAIIGMPLIFGTIGLMIGFLDHILYPLFLKVKGHE